jgi:hypothetical protein
MKKRFISGLMALSLLIQPLQPFYGFADAKDTALKAPVATVSVTSGPGTVLSSPITLEKNTVVTTSPATKVHVDPVVSEDAVGEKALMASPLSLENNYKEEANRIYTGITNYYKNEKGDSTWQAQVLLAYMNADGSLELAKRKGEKYSASGIIDIPFGIFRAMALGLDPTNLESSDGQRINYTQRLGDWQKQCSDGRFSSNMDTNLYAMQAAKMSLAPIDEQKAVAYVASQLKIDGDKAHYDGYSNKIANTAYILLALSLYPENNQSKELMPKCINWLKTQQRNDGTFGWTISDAPLASRALLCAGEDIFSPPYIKGTDDSPVSILNVIASRQADNGGIKNYSSGSPNDRTTLEAYMLLSELKHDKSMFERFSAKVGTVASRLVLSSDNLSLLEGKTSSLSVIAYDEEDLRVPSTSFTWSVVNGDIASVDNGLITALKAGTTDIIVEDASNSSVQARLSLTVEKEIISRIVVQSGKKAIDQISCLVDDSFTLEVIGYNQKDQAKPVKSYQIDLIQDEAFLSNDGLNFTANKIGNGQIKISVEGIEKLIDFSILDIDKLAKNKLTLYKANLLKQSTMNDFSVLLASASGLIKDIDSDKIKLTSFNGRYADSQDYGKRILRVLAQGQDPHKDIAIGKTENIVKELLDSQTEEGIFSIGYSYYERKPINIATSMIALDSVNAVYDIQKSINALKVQLTIEDNKAYVKNWKGIDYEPTLFVTMTLINHKDQDGVQEILKKIGNALTEKFESEKFEEGTNDSTKLGRIARGLNAVGIPLENVKKEVDGKSVSILQMLCERTDDNTEIHAALLEFKNKEVIYNSLNVSTEPPKSLTLSIENNAKTLNMNAKKSYVIDVRDEHDKKIKDFEYTIEALTPGIVQIDKDKLEITAIGVGQTDIKVSIKGTDVTNTLRLQVIIPNVAQTTVRPVKDKSDLAVGKRLKLISQSVDLNGENIQSVHKSDWQVEPSENGRMDGDIFVATKAGPTTIKYLVTNKDGSKVTSSYDIKVVDPINKNTLLLNYISQSVEYLKRDPYNHYPLILAMRNAGSDLRSIQERINILDAGSNPNISYESRNIISIIGANLNPRDYKGKNYVEMLEKSILSNTDITTNDKLYYPIALIALDMAHSDISREPLIKVILSTFEKDGDQQYIYLLDENSDSPRIRQEETLWAWIALSKYQDVKGVSEVSQGIRKYVKASISENMLLKYGLNHSEDAGTTALAIQGIMANHYNLEAPDFIRYDESGNKLTLLDGLFTCFKDDRFLSDPAGALNSDSNLKTTQYAITALMDYMLSTSTYQRLHYTQPGKLVSIDFKLPTVTVVQGDNVSLKPILLDDNGLGNTLEEVQWSVEPKGAAKITPVNTQVIDLKVLDHGTIKITATVKDHDLSVSKNLSVVNALDKENMDKRVEEEMKFFKKIYADEGKSFEFIAAVAAKTINIPQETINKRVYKYSAMTTIPNVSKQIIALIGAGQSPRRYQKNKSKPVINLVDLLTVSQKTSGPYQGQFAFSHYDYDNLNYQTLCIIALDMAKGSYNEKTAVQALIQLTEDYLQDEKKIEAQQLGYVLVALSQHQDKDRVVGLIERIKTKLHQLQNNAGGFDASNGQYKNSPLAIGSVIQGLIAVGEHPLYDPNWIKNRKTVLDALLLAKRDDGYGVSEHQHTKYYKALYHAFAAMTDLSTGKSMFVTNSLDDSAGILKDKQVTKVVLKDIYQLKDVITLTPNQRLVLETHAYNIEGDLIYNLPFTYKLSGDQIQVQNTNELYAQAATSQPITLTVETESQGVKFSKDYLIQVLEESVDQVSLVTSHDSYLPMEEIDLSAHARNQFGHIVKATVTYKLSADSDPSVATLNETTGHLTFNKPGQIKVIAVAQLGHTPKKESEPLSLTVIASSEKNVFVSIHGIDKNGLTKVIYPEKELKVKNFDLGPYDNFKRQLSLQPTAMNALIKRLETEGLDCKTDSILKTSTGMNQVLAINGLSPDSEYQNSGWMYFLNDAYVSVGMNKCQIKDGDHIRVFYVLGDTPLNYYSLKSSHDHIGKNQKIKVTLVKHVKIPNTYTYKKVPVKNTPISLNGKEVLYQGKPVITDDSGQAYLQFEKEGAYVLSAILAKDDKRSIPPSFMVKVGDNNLSETLEIGYEGLDSLRSGYESTFQISYKVLKDETRSVNFEMVLYDDDQIIQEASLKRQTSKGERLLEKVTFLLPEAKALTLKIFYIDEAGNRMLVKNHQIKE